MKQEDKEQYLKRGPLAVLAVLRDLLENQTPVMINHTRGQFITRLLAADREQVVLDYGSNDYDNQLALEANNLHVTAETRGAKVEFALPALQGGEQEGLPAFTAALPDVLWMIQRREFFRVHAPLSPVFYCYIPWPDGSGEGRLRLQDLSLGGIGALAEGPLPETLQDGDTIKKLRVDMGEYGRFEIDTQLVTISQRSVIGSKNQTIVTPRLSLRFVALQPGQERELQQVVFALERLARDKANRFQ